MSTRCTCMQEQTSNDLPSVETAIKDGMPAPFDKLTVRETEVARLLVKGYRNYQIAEALQIGIKTVDTHRGHVMEKTSSDNNVLLTLLALRVGFTTL